MKKYLPNALYVLGVCFAVVGGAGFHNPTATGRDGMTDRASETLAWPLFVGGMVVIVLGGVAQRAMKSDARASKTADGAAEGDRDRELIMTIRDSVVALDEKKGSLERHDLCTRIDDLLKGAFFDLVDRREALLERLGFADYARVWAGVATAERQLARVWSIATDGYLAEAIEDLPAARANMDRAVKEISAVLQPPPR